MNLERISLKSVNKIEGLNTNITMPFQESGMLNSEEHPESGKAFLIKNSSKLLAGNIDDFLITLPFVTSKLVNFKDPIIAREIRIIRLFCDFLKKDFVVDYENKRVVFKFAVKTSRAIGTLNYLPISNSIPLGFTAASRGSSVSIPNHHSTNHKQNKKGVLKMNDFPVNFPILIDLIELNAGFASCSVGCYARAIKKLYGNRCVITQKSGEDCKIVVHHLYSKHQYPQYQFSLFNGVPLSEETHKHLHKVCGKHTTIPQFIQYIVSLEKSEQYDKQHLVIVKRWIEELKPLLENQRSQKSEKDKVDFEC